MIALTLLPLLLASEAHSIRLEAVDAVLTGARLSTERPGFTGRGYVTDITAPNARIVWNVNVPRGGIYRAFVGYSTPSGQKGFDLSVNGRKTGAFFPDSGGAWQRLSTGKVELKTGPNEIAIERGWGYYDLNYVELIAAPAPAALRPVPPRLVNPTASPEARRLIKFLVDQYGKAIISGQYEIREANWVNEQTGRKPAMLGGDFMDYSPSRVEKGANPAGETEKLVELGKRGFILALSWHWNAPSKLIDAEVKKADGTTENLRWYKGFYTNATTFDLAAALADPTGEDYRLLLRDIDVISGELKKLRDAGVPVLWRPLHEAEGRWFWWGAKGPEPCKKLWRIMYDRMTQRHGLNNLIWVWNSAAEDWYPGDDTVDIMSVDHYPSDRTDPLSGAWEDLLARFDGKKLIGLAEFPGAPDTDRMLKFGARWSFFVSWTGDVGPMKTDPEILKRVYNSSKVITLDELPWVKR